MVPERLELRLDDVTPVIVEWEHGGYATELTSDGGVTIREVGGPRFMAAQPEGGATPSLRVVWRGNDSASLHGRTLRVLVELGFPDVPMLPPVPDERITYLTVRDRESERAGSVFVTHALVARAPALAPLIAELDELAAGLARSAAKI